MKKKINKNRRIFGKELFYLKQVLNTEFRSSEGAKMMKKLETEFAKKFNSKYAIAFANGTSTMHTCLEAMSVGIGDEVIVPPLTMSSTSFAVLQSNATPVFADVDLKTFTLDPNSLKKKITKKTKAIITVSLYGLSPEMLEIKKIAKKFRIKIIEDNAECFLGYYRKKIVGSFGDCASYSFQSSKHITSGEGGIVTTSDPKLATKIRRIQSLGYAGLGKSKAKISKEEIQSPNYSRHLTMGWNYRMSELCSAVALGQLENIDTLVKKRIKAGQLFNEVSKKYSDWFIRQHVPENCIHSYWTWTAYIKKKRISWKNFVNKFRSFGGDGIYGAWKLTYHEPFFKKLNFLKREKNISLKNLKLYKKSFLCPNAEYLQPRLLQFKTNYWDTGEAVKQAKILKKTLDYFNEK